MTAPPKQPTLLFCPFCGRNTVVPRNGVPRCLSCRAVFFVQFSRYMRKSKS